MDISGDEVQDINKLMENTSLSYALNVSNCIKEAEGYYLIKNIISSLKRDIYYTRMNLINTKMNKMIYCKKLLT